jgi:hypothetical protein
LIVSRDLPTVLGKYTNDCGFKREKGLAGLA